MSAGPSVKDVIISGNSEQGERHVLAKAVSGYEERLRSLDDAARPEPWTRMTYTEAIAELEKYSASNAHPFQFEPEWGRSLQSEHERWLSEVLIKGPVFVTDYLSSLKPFYMRSNDDGLTACFDLLVPHVGELAGGSLRGKAGSTSLSHDRF